MSHISTCALVHDNILSIPDNKLWQ